MTGNGLKQLGLWSEILISPTFSNLNLFLVDYLIIVNSIIASKMAVIDGKRHYIRYDKPK